MRRGFIALAFAVLAAGAIAQSPTQRAAILSANPVLFRYTAGDSTSGATFSRTSTATYTDGSGVIQTAASGVLRDSHHISSVRTTLLESSRTNHLLRSEEFDNASWTKADTTITANAITSPSGTLTADLLTEGVAGSGTLINASPVTVTANQTHAISGWLKRGNHDWVRIVLYDSVSTADRVTAWFNLNTGAFGTVSNGGTATGAAATVESHAAGWYRYTLVGKPNATGTNLTRHSSSAANDNDTARLNNATRYEWGAQLEVNAASASSYIPTTAATVTRAADSLAYTLGSYPNWTRWEWFYNSAGVLTETVTTGTGSYSFTPTVDRAYRKIVIAKETRDAAYFAGYK